MRKILIVRVCVLLTLLGISRATQTRAATVEDQIRFLLDEEKSLREALQEKVRRLKTESYRVNASIVPCQCSVSTTSRTRQEVAYSGTVSSSTLTSLTGSTVFNFSSDLVNVGQAFDINTGHFVVPTDGLYGFSLSIHMSPSYWTALRLVKNGNQILGVKTGHYARSSTDRQVNMATNYLIGNFSTGEEIWPQYVSGSGSRLYGYGVPTFSVVLLHEF